MTAVLLCCYSKASERAAVCFVPPAVCSCLRTPRIPCILPWPVYVVCNQIRQIGNKRNFEILRSIMYHIIPLPLNCLHTHIHMYVSSSPGEAHHSYFFETCPPFASFVGLPFPVLIGLPGFPAFQL